MEKVLKKYQEGLYKEIAHGDSELRFFLQKTMEEYHEKVKDSIVEKMEAAFIEKLIKGLPSYGIDTSRWEYLFGNSCHTATEFISRVIKRNSLYKKGN